MPILESVYTDPDLIKSLYDNPADGVLLAELALATGDVSTPNHPLSAVTPDRNLLAQDIQGIRGSGDIPIGNGGGDSS